MELLILILMGGLGAVVKDIFKDNYLVLPCLRDGKFYLGCLGGIIIGAVAGYIVDHSPVTAFLAGYSGYQIIESLVNQKEKIKNIRDHRIVDELKKTNKLKEKEE